MDFAKEERTQASIELLILIGGAIVLASIVGILLKNAAVEAANQAGAQGQIAATSG